jgi:hypothetical protein
VPLLPIDLQTIFAQSTTVGKDQAVQRDATPLQQTTQAQHIVQTAQQQDRTVNQTDDSREGEGVKPREDARRGRGENEARKRREKDKGRKAAPREEVFRDPALGGHVDLVG